MSRTLIARTFIAVTLVLLFALGACRKPVFESPLADIPPLVLTTPISDSLPIKAIEALKLGSVQGIKIKHHNGSYSNYFEYQAEQTQLLNIISALPFSMDARAADSTCNQVSFELIEGVRRNLSGVELENTAFFWNSDRDDVAVYQCLKPPYLHIIQIHKASKRVLHRIEFVG